MIVDPTTFNTLKKILSASGKFDEVIKMFHDSTQTRLCQLVIATDNRDEKTLKSVTHSLKGSCAMLGAISCVEICEKIEKLSMEQNLESIIESISNLRNEIVSFETELN